MDFNFLNSVIENANRLFGTKLKEDATEQEVDAALTGIDSAPLEKMREDLAATNAKLEEGVKAAAAKESKLTEGFDAVLEDMKTDFETKLTALEGSITEKLTSDFEAKLKANEEAGSKSVEALTTKVNADLKEAKDNLADVSNAVNEIKGKPSGGTTTKPVEVAGEQPVDEKTGEVNLKKGSILSDWMRGADLPSNN